MSLDADGDGYNHDTDNCVLVSNPDQKDTDGDGLGDVCDPDADNDGLSNVFEQSIGTNPLLVLVVVTPDVRGTAAAQSLCRALAPGRDVRVVVRTHPTSDLDAQAVADWLGAPLAAEIAHDNRLTTALDRGEAPGLGARSRLARVAEALLLDLVATP